MERLDYWRLLSKQQAEAGCASGSDLVQAPDERRNETCRIALLWGGRELSPEAYLAVPTFLRRGLRPGGA